MFDEGDDDVICEIGIERRVSNIFDSSLLPEVSKLASAIKRLRQSYIIFFSVHVPKAFHEELVISRHARQAGKGLRYKHLCTCIVKVEKNVVEQRKFVVHRHSRFADLLVQLLERILGLGGVHFCCEWEDVRQKYGR